MLGELFSPGDFGSPDGGEAGGGFGPKKGGTAGIILPEFRPTGERERTPPQKHRLRFGTASYFIACHVPGIMFAFAIPHCMRSMNELQR